MKDTEGTIVIAEAVKNAKMRQRIGKIAADLLCTLCDNDCTVGEAFAALDATRNAIRETRLNVAKFGNNPNVEDSYGENGE